jgi:hypothetical protein
MRKLNFVGRGLSQGFEAKPMLTYRANGFSVDAGVGIEANDCAALERLLRYCATAPAHRWLWGDCAKSAKPLVYRCG